MVLHQTHSVSSGNWQTRRHSVKPVGNVCVMCSVFHKRLCMLHGDSLRNVNEEICLRYEDDQSKLATGYKK